jgi:hypothetical protein
MERKTARDFDQERLALFDAWERTRAHFSTHLR